MKTEEQQELEETITEWRSKHGISEDDQVMAIAELVEIYASHYGMTFKAEADEPITFEECRGSIRELKVSAHDYARRSRELLTALRGNTKATPSSGGRETLMLVFGCLFGLLGGFIAGKFYL